jgi:hypothetical protein
VILLSGTFEPFDRDRALAAGCSEIITKPFEARKLVETVERLLVGEVSDAPAAAEEAPTPPAEAPVPSDPNMQTVESFPPQVEESEPAAAEPPAAEELPESSLDFTDTGFAEMEEAARQGQQMRSEIPEEGLEFEFSSEHEAFGAPDTAESPEPSETQPEFEADVSAEAATEVDPFAESETTSEVEAFGDVHEVPEFEQEAESVAESGEVETVETAEPVASEFEIAEVPSFEIADAPGAAADIDEGEPFPAAQSPDEIADSAITDQMPFASEEVDEEAEQSFEVSPETVEIPPHDLPIDETTDDEPVQGPEPGNEIVVDVGFEREIDAAPDEEPEVEPQPSIDVTREDEEAAPRDADTGPVPAEVIPEQEEQVTEEPFHPPEPMPPAPPAEMGVLSDEDVDRIARRVLELASDRFEQLAWEIVPDMAEIAVRQRIRELEAEIEGSSEDEPR